MIDVLAREHDGGYLVVDYKSDEVAEGDELEQLVARDYALQREVYALAVLRTGAPWVEVEHWFLARPREWASARFTAAERDALQASLQERLRRALRTGFAVTPRPHRDAVCELPGTGAAVLVAGERDDGARAPAGGELRMSRRRRRRGGLNRRCQLV